MPTHFADLVATSSAVRDASGRLDKVARLADLLRRLADEEIAPAVAFLSGQTRQDRLGIGYAAVAAAADVVTAAEAALSIGDVDRTFDTIATLGGSGSARARARELRELFSRAT